MNDIARGFVRNDPAASFSLHADAYTEPAWFAVDRDEIIGRTWQWVCHVESVRDPGSYVATEVAGRPVVVVRGGDGDLRAFDNVCRHRAHELLSGVGRG